MISETAPHDLQIRLAAPTDHPGCGETIVKAVGHLRTYVVLSRMDDHIRADIEVEHLVPRRVPLSNQDLTGRRVDRQDRSG